MFKTLTTFVAFAASAFGTLLQAQDISAVVSSAQIAVLSTPRGGQITELPIELGKQIKSGDLLARFECAVETAQLAAADAELQIAAIDTRTQRTLVARGAGGRAALSQAIAREKLKSAELQIAQTKENQCSVLAPFDGAISDLSVRAFETVQAGAPLLELVNTDALQLEVIVPAEWIANLRPNAPLIFTTLAPAKEYRARIKLLAPKIDGVSQTIRIIATFEAANALPLPGSAGVVRFE